MLPHIPAKIAAARQCIYQNHLVLKSMLDWLSSDLGAPEPLCYASTAAAAWATAHGNKVNPMDADKVMYVLKNVVRDWSADGEEERSESYGRILAELLPLLSLSSSTDKQQPPRVLVPGCGLGRLCAELASAGCDALGNEHSYYMLMASAFALNAFTREEQFALFPWVHTCNNHTNNGDQLRPVTVPDTVPATLIENKHENTNLNTQGMLGMAAGDFVQVFNDEEFAGSFDAVATCFFIDTAHNFIDYLEVIYKVLRPGGYWVNLGPLQWHWSDAHTYLPGEELSIEVCSEDVVHVAQRIGFEFIKKESGIRCRYMCNDRSMLRQEYQCALFVCCKPHNKDC